MGHLCNDQVGVRPQYERTASQVRRLLKGGAAAVEGFSSQRRARLTCVASDGVQLHGVSPRC